MPKYAWRLLTCAAHCLVYSDGTTDVTRTLHFGTPTEYEKRCFTRVLQGHIALDRAVFPSGTTGTWCGIDVVGVAHENLLYH